MANTAPVLNSALSRVNHLYENTTVNSVPFSYFNSGTNNLGQLVDGVTDIDGIPLGGFGIAITGVTGVTGGIVEYSLDNVHWFVAATAPVGSAIVFKGDTFLRYTPPVNANGARTITFNAWDGTGGYNSGDIVNITAVGTGGSTPFSAASATHTIIIDANDGKVITDLGGYDYAIGSVIDASGNVIAAGVSRDGLGDHIAITRYTSAGSLDTSFSSDGKVKLDLALGIGDSLLLNSLVIDANGKYLISGNIKHFDTVSPYYITSSTLLARLNSDGTFDTTFGGGDGYVVTMLGDGISTYQTGVGYSTVSDASGNILSVGDF